MAECPRCGAHIEPFLVLGVDVTSRTRYAVAEALLFLPVDLFFIVLWWHGLQQQVVRVALTPLAGVALRFALANWLMWQSAMHLSHSKRGSLWDSFAVGIMNAVICFSSLSIWLAANILWPLR